MHLFPCDGDKTIQQFDFERSPIKLKDTNMCVAFRGNTAQLNDPTLLKTCDEAGGSDYMSVDD
jgi:hypothetical protein